MLLSEKSVEMSDLFQTKSDKWPNVKNHNINPGREQISQRTAKIGFCLLAALSMCLEGNNFATVFKSPNRRQSPTVFDFIAFMHAVI